MTRYSRFNVKSQPTSPTLHKLYKIVYMKEGVIEIKSSLGNPDSQPSLQTTDSKAGVNQLECGCVPVGEHRRILEAVKDHKRQENGRSWSPGGKPWLKLTPQGEGRVWAWHLVLACVWGAHKYLSFLSAWSYKMGLVRRQAALSKTPRLVAEPASPALCLTNQQSTSSRPGSRRHFPHSGVRASRPRSWDQSNLPQAYNPVFPCLCPDVHHQACPHCWLWQESEELPSEPGLEGGREWGCQCRGRNLLRKAHIHTINSQGAKTS